MDTRGVSVVLLKLTGLVLIVISVSQLPSYFPLSGRGYDFSMGQVLGTAALALAPLALIGLVLWFFPGTVANKVVSGAPADVDLAPIELVALTILGLYLVTDGIIAAVRSVVLLIFMSRQDLGPIPVSVLANIAATAAELLIGFCLCIGAKGVARVLEGWRRP